MERSLGNLVLVLLALAASGCALDDRSPSVVDAMSQDMEFRGSRPTLPDAPGQDTDRVADTTDAGRPLGDGPGLDPPGRRRRDASGAARHE